MHVWSSHTDCKSQYLPDKLSRPRRHACRRALKSIQSSTCRCHDYSIREKQTWEAIGRSRKAAKVIHDAVSGNDPSLASVLRLPLGVDGWEAATAHMDQVRNDFNTCKDVAYSTNRGAPRRPSRNARVGFNKRLF